MKPLFFAVVLIIVFACTPRDQPEYSPSGKPWNETWNNCKWTIGQEVKFHGMISEDDYMVATYLWVISENELKIEWSDYQLWIKCEDIPQEKKRQMKGAENAADKLIEKMRKIQSCWVISENELKIEWSDYQLWIKCEDIPQEKKRQMKGAENAADKLIEKMRKIQSCCEGL